MGFFRNIFETFSKRSPETSAKVQSIPDTTRTRVLRWCGELYRGQRPSEFVSRPGDLNQEFWTEIYKRLQYRTGRPTITVTDNGRNPAEALNYVMTCRPAEFLDFLEDIFNNEVFRQVNSGDKNIVDELNEILRRDNLPYTMTHFVQDTVKTTSGHFAGCDSIVVRSYPKVILKESEVLEQEAIAPTLQLLAQPHFASANKEFLEALEDYRKGDIGDCLTKSGSALESVMKVICDRKGWPYKQEDTAATLIDKIVQNSSLDGHFKKSLLGVAIIRNALSTSHGAGTKARQPARHLAQYVLNMTASAMLMLTQETGV